MKYLRTSLSLIILMLTSTLTLMGQTRNLYIEGSGDQLGVIQTTDEGSSTSGIELLRGGAFSGTDWRIINDGGTFKILDGINNFSTAGTENLTISNNGVMTLLSGIEASVGGTGGYLVLGNPTGQNLALDRNEILARNGANASDLFIQPGGDVGNTYINIADGNVGIGDLIAPVKLSIFNGTDVTTSSGGFLLLGSQNSNNIAIDNNEIMARNGSNPADLFLQTGTTGNLSIGAGASEVDTKLTIEDTGYQMKFTNANDNNNNWYVGASSGSWIAGAGKLVFDDDMSTNNPILMLDGPAEAVAIGIETIPAGYKFAVDGKVICEEVLVELSGAWPDYVFEDDYELTPISKLEKEIQHLGHLPNVPSAEEIDENGIVLGEMQQILLRKIEELTLYIIDLKKENDDIKSRLNQLSSTIK